MQISFKHEMQVFNVNRKLNCKANRINLKIKVLVITKDQLITMYSKQMKVVKHNNQLSQLQEETGITLKFIGRSYKNYKFNFLNKLPQTD